MQIITRRTMLRAGLALAASGVVGACGRDDQYVQPDDDAVRAVEDRRRHGGTTHELRLTAVAGPVDLGGLTAMTWSYGGQVPGREIRVRAGDRMRVTVTNRLPDETSVHWHGLALRNDADGVPHLTQPPIRPGREFGYEFTADQPGTYWFHPHTGTQLDRGLYAPLIVEDRAEPGDYDAEWVVVLDDWLDGLGGTPDDVLAALRRGMRHGSMGHGAMGHGGMGDGGDGGPSGPPGGPAGTLMGASSALLGGDAGDVRYPYYLLGGRLPTAPLTHRARPGARLRIRFVNAGSDTAFRVALGGHRMRVTHTDGYPVQPIDTDALLIGMGERYDVLVTLGDGVFPLVALAEGKNARAFGLIRTAGGAAPPASVLVPQLTGRVVGYPDLRAADAVRLTRRGVDRAHRLELTGGMMRYDWGINGRPYDPKRIIPVRAGERVRLSLVNRTMMWHPIHLHGHTFQLGPTGPRKDTVAVLPHQRLDIDFDADNPGLWMYHCHNAYHAETGMMGLLGYRR